MEAGKSLTSRFRLYIPAGLAFALATVLSTRRAIWNDEGATIYRVAMPWRDFIDASIHRTDLVHATYYAIVKALHPLVGYDLFRMRLISAAAVALSVIGLGKLIALLLDSKSALLGQIIFIALPVTMDFGTDARSYALATTAAIWLSYYFFLILARQSHNQAVGRLYFLYIALAIFAIHLFIYLAFFPVVTLIYLLITRGRSMLRPFLLSYLLIYVLCSPVLYQASTQSSQINWLSRSFISSIGDAFTIATASTLGIATFISGIGCALVLLNLLKKRSQLSIQERSLLLFSLILAFIPALVLIGISLIHPLFTQRYLAPFSFTFALILVIVVRRITGIAHRLFILVLVAICLVSTASNFQSDGRDLWALKREILVEHAQSGDAVMAVKAHYERLFQLDPIPGLSIVRQEKSPVAPDALANVNTVTLEDSPARIFLLPSKSVSEDYLTLMRTNGYHQSAQYPVGPGAILEFVLNK